MTSTTTNILEMIGLYKLPNYWWSDDELASIANHISFDLVILIHIVLMLLVIAK